MSNERAQAMENEAKNPYGRPNFLYVDQDELERFGITQFKAAVSDNVIRIIPPLDPRVPWAKKIFIHRDIGANNSTFLCLNKMFGKPCPVCEHAKRIKDKDPDNEGLSALWPKLRHLIFLYDVTSQKEEEKGLRWWDAPASKSCAIVENIVALSRDPNTNAPLDVSDPETGKDIRFTRKGTDRNTTYMGYQLLDNGAIPKEWYENVPTFESILEIPAYEEIYKELHGVEPTKISEAKIVGQPSVTAPAVDEREIPADTRQESNPQAPDVGTPKLTKPAQETRTRRSYGNTSSQNSSNNPVNESSINQRFEEIKARRAARANGG